MYRQVVKVMQKVEKVLVRVAVLGLLGLLVVQLVLARAKDPIDFYLAFAQTIETASLEESDLTFEPNLILTADSDEGAKVKILVNDKVIGNLSSGKLSLKVQKGDRLAADARGLSGTIRLKVTGVGKDLAFPVLNQVWPLRGSVLDLGEVKMK